MQVIDGIDCLFDQNLYDEHGLNCFYVPKYIATQAYGQQNPDLFYLYFYFYLHYNVRSDPQFPQPYNNDSLDLTEAFVLKEKLGLEIVALPADEDLVLKIEEQVRNGWPVFVPVNKKAIFYCEEYLKKDHPHLTLIKGFDSERKVFVIQDGEHNVSLTNSKPYPALRTRTGDVCSQFYMLYDMLESGYGLYNESFEYMRGTIKVLKPLTSVTAPASGVLTDLSGMILEYAGQEEQLIGPKFDYLLNHDTGLGMAYANTQKVLFKMILKFMAANEEDPSRIAQIQTLMNDCHEAWKKLIHFVMFIHKREQGSAEETLKNQTVISQFQEEIIQLERKLLDQLARIGTAVA
ncbi:hypothetical protein [Paenibacillus lutrae]|uniref:Butirosin biosynthesis protein H N-terminal domain-containing protein n=1 Tax=Paenibacillus lutrae TaxID=2078573 RepID=A0A7X3FLR8_9BACL|nr:hypothetical protein [Paenibacillus lutrae]MVP01962.1 hypothetical protein [Paenibacillus lutrae]